MASLQKILVELISTLFLRSLRRSRHVDIIGVSVAAYELERVDNRHISVCLCSKESPDICRVRREPTNSMKSSRFDVDAEAKRLRL